MAVFLLVVNLSHHGFAASIDDAQHSKVKSSWILPVEDAPLPAVNPSPAISAKQSAKLQKANSIGLDPERALIAGADDEPESTPHPIAPVILKTSTPSRSSFDDPERMRADVVDVDESLKPNANTSLHNKNVATPTDPEIVRQIVDDDDSLAPSKKTSPAPIPGSPIMTEKKDSSVSRVRFDDPEHLASTAVEDSGPELTAPTRPTSSAPTTDKSASVITDKPRFVSGQGLDSNSEEISAEKTLAAKRAKAAELLKRESDVPAPAVAAAASVEKNDANSSNSHDKADSKNAAPGEKPEQVDPEKQFNQSLKEISEAQKRIKAELARRAAMDDDPIHARDPRAKSVLSVLKSKVPLGNLGGRIVDAQRSPVAARIKLTDQTNSSVDAPLAEGFWCPGRFNTHTISGPVRMEVTRGRFSVPCVKGIEVLANIPTTVEVTCIRPNAVNFAAKGWHLADLDFGMRLRPGERQVWLGQAPKLDDLILAALGEDIHILGVPVPWGDAADKKKIETLVAQQDDIVLLPLFAGPRHVLHGCAMGLGLKSYQGMQQEISDPEIPLRESFEEIRIRGGLAVFKNPAGLGIADIQRDMVSLFPRLVTSGYFGENKGHARLYAGTELPFDVISGQGFDVLSFDGSDLSEQLWFNMLSQGYNVSVIGASGGSLEGGAIPFGQTFIHMTGKPTVQKVMDNIKQGHTCVSFGPAAFCKILERDMGPGSVLPADGRPLTLQVQVYASMGIGAQIDTIEILRNNEVISSQTANDGETQIDDLRFPIAETSSAWYVVRVTEKFNLGAISEKGGRAWTSPIFFRTPDYSPPAAAMAQIKGTLRAGVSPAAGTITIVVPGRASQQVATDANGHFTVKLPIAGGLIFEAPGCEPQAKRVFEHPKIQRALGMLQCGHDGELADQFARTSLFPAWTLLVSELEWNVSLSTARKNQNTENPPISETK